MLPIEDQISILAHLSMADGIIAKEESAMIHDVGEKSGLTTEAINLIIANPKPVPNLANLIPDDKFEYLHNVIQLMKVDKKVHQKEINFCERLAHALGYKPGVVADLSAYIYSDPSISTKRSYLRSIADSHLMKRK
ncbi:MAG: uncharacterized membrane protein YebE (DUF533 family) [Cyclobacteriaceae bacterium]|jgi:uncharacterized membrane protein YebE (DUF533 family)